MRRLAAILALTLCVAPASAQKSADTLRIVWRDQIPDADPYYNNLRTGLIVAHHAWDGLIFRDPIGFTMKPLLAKSWKWIDDTTLEFELRADAKFHNGDPVTAADVVYTVQQITDPKSGISVPSNFTWLASAEAIDPTHVRLKTKQAFPAALEYIAFVMPIYPAAYRERVGRDVYRREPIGAGPYRITKVDGINQIDMERFEAYYDGGGKGRPSIRRLVIREVTDATTELTALLGGQADWIWQYNPDQFDKIAAVPTLAAVRQESFRIVYLQLDAAGRADPKSPLTDPRVRRAIFHAIDRQAFAKQIMQGSARVPDAPCYFTQFGCDQSAAVHYDYDPARAKQLLAEAGYPNGFDTEIVAANFLSTWTGAIQNWLQAVGIRAKITNLQASAMFGRLEKGEVPLGLSSWGSFSINDASAILPYFFNGDTIDTARDPQVTAALKLAGGVADPRVRSEAYSRAIQRITDQAYFLPITTSVTVYGLSRGIEFTPWADEMPRFFWTKWK